MSSVGTGLDWENIADLSEKGLQIQSRRTGDRPFVDSIEYRWRYKFDGSEDCWRTGYPRPSDLGKPTVPTPPLSRKSVLDQAAAVVLKNREAQYGSPEDSFGTIAEFWTTFLRRRGLLVEGKTLTSAEVAALMALLKLARIAETINHADSIVDLAGYAACLGEVSSQTKAP